MKSHVPALTSVHDKIKAMKQRVSKLDKAWKAEIKIPGDKSISHRAVIFGALAEGLTEVENFLTGEDCICTANAFKSLGLEIEINGTQMRVHGIGAKNFSAASDDIYLGNSGTAMRLLAGLFSGLPFKSVLTGDKSLSARPMGRVIKPLAQMGASIESENLRAPLVINGKELKPFHYDSPIASAQVKSSILLAGLFADGLSSVTEPHKSRDHTERMLKAFGADLREEANKVSLDNSGMKSINNLKGQKFLIPSDISSAAFFLVAGAILPDTQLSLRNIGVNPTRTGIIDVMRSMNVDFDLENERLEGAEPVADIIVRSSKLKGTTIAADLIPRLIDEIPVIAILAAQAEGQTIIKDAEELRVKESDRIKTTINMLKALGVEVVETDDGMIIEGRAGRAFKPSEPEIDSHGDHRLAMSSAIAALHSEQSIDILQTEFVDTSFPGFFNLLPVN